MSDLTDFAAHARRMATAQHKPECTSPQRPFFGYSTSANPQCLGCVTDADRAWWQKLADEVDAHLARPKPEPRLRSVQETLL